MNIQDAYPLDCIHEMYKHNIIDKTNYIVQCLKCNMVYKCIHNKGFESFYNGYPQNGEIKYCKICKCPAPTGYLF